MAETRIPKGKSSEKPKSQASVNRQGGVILLGDNVRVWSQIGVTLPLGEDTTAHLRFDFGHERIAKKGTDDELRRVAALVDEFNEAELERRLSKYLRLIDRVLEGGDDDDEDEKPKGSPRERARKRLRNR